MESQLQAVVARNIKRYRKARKYTQSNLSLELDKSWNYINSVENGNCCPSLEVIEQLAKIFDIQPYKLLIDDDSDVAQQTENKHFKSIEESASKLQEQLNSFLKKTKV